MSRFLIPLTALFIAAVPSLSFSQTPVNISVPVKIKPDPLPIGETPESAACNFAGTFDFGQFTGQSKDHSLPTIYLCAGDKICLNHNHDYDLSGDPQPSTAAGVSYAFYNCMPTVTGMTLANVIADPCVNTGGSPAPAQGIWVDAIKNAAEAMGDKCWTNDGSLQTFFNMGKPLLQWYAPITVDSWATNGFEQTANGQPYGPCVSVNTAEKFDVVYLNPIVVDNITTPVNNNGCIGYFRPRGGLSEFDGSPYTLTISGPGQALVATSPADIKHGGLNPVIDFSAPGNYTITVDDGVSCNTTFTMDMTGCDATDNVVIIIPDVSVDSGMTQCFDILVNNFTDISVLQATIHWDPTLFEYVSLTKGPTFPDLFPNDMNAPTTGSVGFSWYSPTFTGEDRPDGTVLFTLCLKAIGPMGSSSPIILNADLVKVEAYDGVPFGVAVNFDPGTIQNGMITPFTANANVLTNCTSSGSFQVTASGGTPTYTIKYQNSTFMTPIQTATFSGSYTVSNLSGGDYGITVTDAAGASYTTTVTIYSIGTSLLKNDPTCFGKTDGVATVEIQVNGMTVSNPGSEFSFTWSPAGPNSPIYNGLGAGPISVTVTNTNNGCTATASATLNSPTQIFLSNVNTTDATCSGIANGKMSFNIIGGTAPYTYNIQPNIGSNTGNAYVNNAILANNYMITVTDFKGCSRTDAIEVFAQKTYDLDTIVTQLKCFGDKNATIQATLKTSAGLPTPPLNFQWVGNGMATSGGFSSTYSNLGAGLVSLSVTDATGCGQSATFTIKEPKELIATPVLKNPSCSFGNDGSVSLFGGAVTGGTPLYKFLWSNGATTSAINNLLPGNYAATVTDANGCTDAITATLTVPKPPVITKYDSTSVSCNSSTNGSLTVHAMPGEVGATIVGYKWSPSNSTTMTANNLACGTHYVTVSDDNGCQTKDTINLYCPPPLAFVDTIFTQPTCPGDANGKIQVIVSGGTGAYTYTWNTTGGSGNMISNKKAGNYGVTVKDAKGCSLTGTFTLTDPQGINATFSNLVNASCAGTTNCNGSVVVSAKYPDNHPATFTYNWNNGQFFGANPTTLCGGVNNVLITDNATGCKITSMITVGAPPQLVINANGPLPTSCNGVCDGTASVTVTGGVQPYSISWNNGETGQFATALCAGPVVATVIDANNCQLLETLPNEVEPQPVQVFFDLANSMDVGCSGTSTGQIGWQVTGGNQTNPFTWTWAPNVGNTQIVQNLAAGTYAVTATDINGCSGTATATLQNPPAIQYSLLPIEPIKCFGEQTFFTIGTVTGGTGGPFTYSIDDEAAINVDIPSRIDGGDHTIVIIDDEQGANCRETFTISVPQPPEIQVSLGPDITIELGDTLNQLVPQFNIQVDSFVWSDPTGLRTPLDLRPYVSPTQTTSYTLQIFDANGCFGSDEILVEVDPNRKVYIPNIFKPGTPLSDHFKVFVGNGVELVNFMQVYDRWGELMFEQRNFYPSNGDYAEGWDGSYRGKPVNPGVYVYLIEVKFLDGRVLLYRGDVTLARDK